MNLQSLYLIFFILVANGTPILLRHLLKDRFPYTIDNNFIFFDGYPLLGHSKTWRGLTGSLIITSLISLLFGYGLLTGFLISLAAMSGDILSSFIKRRLGMSPSSMAPLLDQLPESLFPALLLQHTFNLSFYDLLFVPAAFIILEFSLSRLLYSLGIRRQPY